MERFTKEWFAEVIDRMIRTGAEMALASGISTAVTFDEVHWTVVIQSVLLGMLTSFLLALAGLPDHTDKTESVD